jgi:precorrin-6B C5,15-methyltransferase / cobalt-precorrin-6B C5,C15-methyltransferase
MSCCHIVGIHDDGGASLTAAARRVIGEAALVIGAAPQLRAAAELIAVQAEQRDSSGQLTAVPGWVDTALGEGRQVVVLATGDPLCFGIAASLVDKLGQERVVVVPTLSSLQLACARFGLPWNDAKLVSVHAADSGEWFPGARHDHALAPLARALAGHDKILCLTSPANGPDRIARMLFAAGLAPIFRLDVAARLASPDEQLFAGLSAGDAAGQSFPSPNVVVLRRIFARPPRPIFGLDDDGYAQRQPEKGLLTKLEARAVSLAKLRLRPASLVWDIGAGAGTVGLEAAGLCRDGHVYAIEKNPEDAANAHANATGFGVLNYTLAQGKAPQGLDTWPDPDAVFIGGSGGELATLIELCLQRLRPGGRLVMNFVTLENLATATAALSTAGAEWDVVQLSAARSQPILDMHRMAAQNPVWIVSADKPFARPDAAPAVSENIA